MSKSQAGRAPVIVAGDGSVASCVAASCSSRVDSRASSWYTEDTSQLRTQLADARHPRLRKQSLPRGAASSLVPEPRLREAQNLLGLDLRPSRWRVRALSRGAAVQCAWAPKGPPFLEGPSAGTTFPGARSPARAVRVRTKPSRAFASAAAGSPFPPGFDSYTEYHRGEMSIFFKFSKSP